MQWVSRHWGSRLGQRLNEKLLRSELEAIEEVVADSRIRPISEDEGKSMIRSKTVDKAKRMVGISRKSNVDKDRVRRYHLQDEGVLSEPLPPRASRTSVDPLAQFESLRHASKYQDLTHEEIRRMQELRERKKMFDRKIAWLKKNEILDPVRAVNKMMRKDRKETHNEWVTKLNIGEEEEGVIREELDPQMMNKVKQIEFKMERDTAVSRLRADARKIKLENSIVDNMYSPNIGNLITDPLKRHLHRRKIRVAILIQQYLEEFLTCNSAQILVDHLGGAGVSVERVNAPSTRGVHKVFVRVTTGHDPKWVQERLTILAPKLRSQLAVRVNYGYTPELEFQVLHDVDKFNKKRLLAIADQAKSEIDQNLHRRFLKQMNWK